MGEKPRRVWEKVYRYGEGASGRLVYTYDLYGNATADLNVNNPFQYTGRENDGDGLYYYRARYYSPTQQRFVSQDPLELRAGINVYAYVSRNPVNRTDPSGLLNLVATAGGSVVVGAVGADLSSSIGYNVESDITTAYATTGAGSGLDSGFAGLMAGAGVTFAMIKGTPDNVNGVFDNNALSLPFKWPVGISVYRSPDGDFQGIGLSIGPGIGAGRTKTNTESHTLDNPRQDMFDRSNHWAKKILCGNSG